ncbi:bifunctional phosphoribosyl-AMP cyclohydrolase/phosphoribosyl-ATP diphosphatase HisIE [Sphingomonas sp. HDW15A]|uniref:bifunctional phosphoribosyl-AMP cyclohydrolase/phosphoribosyl-ATP diphosphatase HisIE n=1 Tax=Sphingomonas sp. HDW15A TaxID=2714942 RepID=UPI0014096328|nr:bifunctional phosphoribosyl-AMP cyclohydrolase/phosphoribosyl-ATP diphosphatase HisIE [Sphingomonas sp. HDW15A]QIK95519.1 bifunctional phosphoribosyl-AMP cyclohydrolase/phosphoribosyl-ATP diphosphatase HisIE [Sphingomonas sp. HDW15A]
MIDLDSLDWSKSDGLLPAIVQDAEGMVRMLGYMDRAALKATIEAGFVTFLSRSKSRLWVKGETSGNRLRLRSVAADCDNDALLIRADPEGPTCHTGAPSCFGSSPPFFPGGLERVVRARAAAGSSESYTSRLAAEGRSRIAQKVGEEGVEVALAAVSGDRDELVSEAADLAFHLTLLLSERGIDWREVSEELERRHRERTATASS